MKIELKHVHYMPKELSPNILYVSKEFKTAAHLCACGCGKKIRTPLTPTEWSLKETNTGPSLYPSVGNWQQKCQSHYWINQGEIKWAEKWSSEQISSGHRREEERRRIYYDAIKPQHGGFMQWIWNWIINFLK